MKIKNVKDYSLAGEKPYLATGFISGILLLSFGFIVVASPSFIPVWLGFGSVAVGMVSTIVYASLSVNQEQRQDDIARNAYRQLPLEILKKGTVSPELSEHTRYVISSLLNKEFEGWSFQ